MNKTVVEDDVIHIILGDGVTTRIDKTDAWVLRHHWSMDSHGNAGRVTTHVLGKTYFLHRMLMGAAEGEIIDHISRDPLDNRRCNLRVTNFLGNAINRGTMRSNKLGVAGVAKKGKRYRARITVNGKLKIIGMYDTIEEASAAFQEAKRLRDEIVFGQES